MPIIMYAAVISDSLEYFICFLVFIFPQKLVMVQKLYWAPCCSIKISLKLIQSHVIII